MPTSPYYVKTGEVSSDICLAPGDLMYVSSGGTAVRIENEGGMHVLTGGQVERTIVFNEGWMILSSGIGIRTTLRDGGRETILSGTETSASVLNGGSMYVPGGLCRNATVSGGLLECSTSGTVRSAAVADGGRIDVTAGGIAYDCRVSSGGTFLISSGGSARRNKVFSGGLVKVLDSGAITSACVGSPGTTEPPAEDAVLELCSGGSAITTSVYMGGMVSFENSDALQSSTKVYGGSLSGNDLVLSSGCSVLFESGGTADLSTLTIQSGGLMQVDSGTTLRFQNIVLDGNPSGFTMKDMAAYDPATGTFRKLLDWTAGTTEAWTETQYRDLLNITDEALFSSAFLYQDGDLYLRGAAQVFCPGTEAPFSTVQAALATNPSELIIKDGEFDAASNIPTFEGVTTTINGGIFTTSVCGGSFYREPAATPSSMEIVNIGSAGDKQNISLTINDGTFNRIVFAGDRADRSLLTVVRTGDITTTITGGVFKNAVAGAMAVTDDAVTILNKLVGNVSLTIKGGTFTFENPEKANKDWIYGGSIATTKTVAGTTTIEGNVTVTLDASDNDITIGNLVAGSYGFGKIIGNTDLAGNTDLVLKGTNNITATGEIWGGCSGDTILYTRIKKDDGTNSGNHEVSSQVSGSRILTFTGFKGTLLSEKNRIRAFSDIEVKGNSDATVANAEGGSVNLSDVVNWTFENGSTLTGNFINDFNGDTLDLLGFTSAVKDYVLMVDASLSSNDIFNAFDQLTAIRMDGNAVGITPGGCVIGENTLTWSWNAGSTTGESPQSWLAGSLEVNRTTGKMTLTTTIA